MMNQENKSGIENIYFDMDGVLADFDNGVRNLCHMEPIPQNMERYQGYDDELWAHIRQVPHFYDLLEPMPGAQEMFREVYRRYGNRCQILTGIPKPRRGITTASEDKIKWVKRLLDPEVIVHTVLREEKKNYCKGKRSVLVDDLKTNIQEWEEAGGTGILYLDAEKTLESINALEKNLS